MKIPYVYYLNDKNQVSIDPTKADAVIMIYDMYIEDNMLTIHFDCGENAKVVMDIRDYSYNIY